ncbi:unnamed protein product [Linum trigynum]|uniref:Uncharacterized protein n=1 Tax=Linum trigynum TaxID=586398 RepID=A0AAV2FCN7_9ROSI
MNNPSFCELTETCTLLEEGVVERAVGFKSPTVDEVQHMKAGSLGVLALTRKEKIPPGEELLPFLCCPSRYLPPHLQEDGNVEKLGGMGSLVYFGRRW